jgi:tetratricopeptide (TPR) repeat protein
MPVPSVPDAEARSEILGRTAEAIVGELFEDPARRAEYVGEAFLACEQAVRESPARYAAAVRSGTLREFLLPAVRSRVRRERPNGTSGGWLGVFIGPDARAIESEESSGVDRVALETSRQALRRAFSLAEAEGNATLLRNLSWHALRLQHRSYAAIAAQEGRPKATIRTGVARARKFILRVVHELEQDQPAPLSGEAPAELEPLRKLWAAQQVERLRLELERTRLEYSNDPHWLNLSGLVAQDREDRQAARRIYERALVFADAPSVRGRVLNNLGNLAEDENRLEEARRYWLRAHQILPHAPAPVLNLLASASVERSYASAQHYITTLGDLLRSGKLSPEERMYVRRRLRENPKFSWLCASDAWRAGPARWARAALGVLLALWLGFQLGVEPLRGSRVSVLERSDAKLLIVAGDSMGKSTNPRPRRPVRKVAT